MTLKSCILTNNDCYKSGKKITKLTGIVIHSTGAINPDIKRYIQPLKSDIDYDPIIKDIGTNKYNNHWNKPGFKKCVHGFIGRNAAGNVETYQTLPFDVCCWGIGKGDKGSYNYNPTAHLQFEICESSDKTFFKKQYNETVELCAFLCKKYNLKPDSICSHKEAHDRGYGSNHGDCDSYFKRYGKSMDEFRKAVENALNDTTTAFAKAHGKSIIKPIITINVGDAIRVKKGIITYSSGKIMPKWVRTAKLYVRNIEDNGKVYLVSTQKTLKVYTGRIFATDVDRL